jgi:chromosome segregation protein
MHFTRLRLSGFKSFVDATELLIEPGTTGIVGPNGCGKSNLVEALRWVMGEASAKRMRGGEMDDVIFSGTSNRPMRNIGEVSLSLDNADRSAPAAFNNDDDIEVSRRIEREQGSRYSVNGQDVRARDVQLLFADAASGANSIALVSQGRIGSVINAKPTDRRSILEEAAGIRGLHSRRHEAELRLRAAEANVERVHDVVQALQGQLQGLKRQARQASRYRNISGHVRAAEAGLWHQRWVEAAQTLDAAQAALREAEAAVTERTGVVAAASSRQVEAAASLPALRDSEAALGVTLHRLAVERDGLDADEERANESRARLRDRLEQIAGDSGRESGLKEDAERALARLADERQRLETARDDEAPAREAAAAKLDAARQTASGNEATLHRVVEEEAARAARRAQLDRHIEETSTRLGKLARRLGELQAEAALLTGGDGDPTPPIGTGIEALRSGAEAARGNARQTANERRAAAQRLDAAREAQGLADTKASRASAEADALADLLRIDEEALWPPLIDAVRVESGLEAAVAAALGDDLSAAMDTGAPAHWRVLSAYPSPPALPDGATALAEYVIGPGALRRRLSQIGVVSDEEGPRLAAALAQGQRLVSRAGALWRWDGYTAAADAGTAAAKRLSQRNRLDELRRELEGLDANAAAARRTLGDARQAFEDAEHCETAAIAAAHEAEDGLGHAVEADRQRTERTSRAAQLRETAQQAAGDITEADANLAAAKTERDALADGEALLRDLDRARADLDRARSAHAAAHADHDRLSVEAAQGAKRLSAIAEEEETWRTQAESAGRQIEALAVRETQAQREIGALDAMPDEIASRRSILLTEIDRAEFERKDAAGALAGAETKLADLDRGLNALQTGLAQAREARVRVESGVEATAQALKDVAATIRERLECEPQEALEKANVKSAGDLPDQAALEARLERLRRERERMGPVNLRADIEAAEIAEQVSTLESERDDLVAAIARLRQGISSLNREGRERLLASYKEVDKHFGELFVRMFGGGHGHLALTESDDPLEAGLEIMASPPGKRLQTMSLLSGGEQALTALCLLFAVFLTNPAPICVLDEVDAPLDESNVGRFCDLVDTLTAGSATRFLIITHNSITMARMDRLYGVTMEEAGVSELVSVDLARAEGLREVG